MALRKRIELLAIITITISLLSGMMLVRSVQASNVPSSSMFTAQILIGDQAVSKNENNVVVLEKNEYSTDQYWEFIPVDNGYYKIINKSNGQALDVSGALDKNGSNVQLYNDNGTKAQQWRLLLNTDGSYNLKPACSNARVMDVVGGQINKSGTNVQLYQDNNTKAQNFKVVVSHSVQSSDLGNFTARLTSNNRALSIDGSNAVVQPRKIGKDQVWRFVYSRGSGTYTITNVLNGKCLDVSGGADRNGANIQTYAANNTNAQRWYLLKHGDGSYYLRPAISGSRTIDISGNGSKAGTNVQLYTMNKSAAQKFSIEKCASDDGQMESVNLGNNFTAKLTNINSGKVVAESAASMATQQTYAGGISQQFWRFTYKDGSYTITNVASGKALDVKGAIDKNGTIIQTYASNNTNAQKWVIEKNGSVYNLKPASSLTRVLDISGATKDEGAKAQLYTSNGSAAQGFLIEKTSVTNAVKAENLGDGFTARITNSNSGKSVTINGTTVDQQNRMISKNQGWTFKRNADNSYTIVSLTNASKALDVKGAADKDSTDIQIYTSNGTKAQRWIVVKSGNLYLLKPESSMTRVMDINGASKNNHANVQLYTANNTGAQKFTINKADKNSFGSTVSIGDKGVDVSEWQGYISQANWKKAKNAGIKYAMLRIAWGHKGNGAADKQFNNNYQNTKANGIPVGVYVYSYADTEAEAREEADYAVSLLAGKKLQLPVCIDVEDKRIEYLSKTQQAKNIVAFCERVKSRGYTPMLYANQNWLKNKIEYNRIKNYRIWYAQYPYHWSESSKPSYGNHIDIWQYSSSGRVSGLSGNIDMNKAYAAF